VLVNIGCIDDVREIALRRHEREDGELVVVEAGKDVPFAIVRMFTVRASEGAVRGRHAHQQCSQIMICVHGAIRVECDDGKSVKNFLLDRGDVGLLVPPGIWATETYRTGNSILAVLCDRPFEEADYIRDHGEFLAWRRSQVHR